MPEREPTAGYVQWSFDFEEASLGAQEQEKLQLLHDGIAPYLDAQELRRLAAEHEDLFAALRSDNPPVEVRGMVELLAALLTPRPYEKIRGPSDVAALLMVQMAHLDQEELRTVLLDNKNQVQRIVTIYRGNVNTSVIRVGEVFKEALKKNCPAIILAHNHPSGDPTPSPEDERVTVQLVKAGKLLDVEIHDHLVIGHGKFVSMKERGLGFRRI
jgi:DNA repair protein RadC